VKQNLAPKWGANHSPCQFIVQRRE
jgi:hypothetical protein